METKTFYRHFKNTSWSHIVCHKRILTLNERKAELKLLCTSLSFAPVVPPVVEVSEPPFNSPLQERVANQRIAFPCPAKGTLASSALQPNAELGVSSAALQHIL